MPKASPVSASASPSAVLSGALPGATAKVPASYEAALAELEALVGKLESGEMPLEQLLAGYQRGAQLLGFCRDRLEAVENQIKVLDEGTLKTWTPE
jgi:exodeoxyribonuclease VII small subunit